MQTCGFHTLQTNQIKKNIQLIRKAVYVDLRKYAYQNIGKFIKFKIYIKVKIRI